MKTVSYPNLPILKKYKENNKCPMKFSSVINGFATSFSLNPISERVRDQAIVEEHIIF